MRNDRGGVIVGYFTKIVVALAAVALFAFDGVSLAAAKVSIADTASSAAYAAAHAWDDTRDAASAYRAAEDAAEGSGAELDRKGFEIARDGTVTVSVRKKATTLLLFRTKKTDAWTKVSASASSKAV